MGKQKTQIINQLRLFKKKIEKKYLIEKIILFGSAATGTFTKDSDIDLIIVAKSFKDKKSFKRSPPLYKEWGLHYPVDFLCFTPQEFDKKKKMIGIVHEAVKHGVEI